MQPVDFKGTNITMKAPEGAENVADVRAFRNRECCVTCWQMTEEERAEFLQTGRIYLSVFYAGGMPPVFLGTESQVRPVVADYGGTFPKQEA